MTRPVREREQLFVFLNVMTCIKYNLIVIFIYGPCKRTCKQDDSKAVAFSKTFQFGRGL